MGKELIINRLVDGPRLSETFKNLETNNVITFSQQGIAIAYAPNGEGKTTITNICKGKPKAEFDGIYEGTQYDIKTSTTLFHVINDQISRNIIKGNTDEFILGDNIRQERELKNSLDAAFRNFFARAKDILKNEYFCSKKNTPFIDSISNSNLKKVISATANRSTKVNSIKIAQWIEYFLSFSIQDYENLPAENIDYFLKDMSVTDSLIEQIKVIPEDKIVSSKSIKTFESNKTAITILNKYIDSKQCIVCDTEGIEPEVLIKNKSSKNEQLISSLNSETKSILENIIGKLTPQEDPFNFILNLTEILTSGNIEQLQSIKKSLIEYQNNLEIQITNSLLSLWKELKIEETFNEYDQLIKKKLSLESEDEMIIENMIIDTLDRKVNLERDAENNIIIKLGDVQLIDNPREDLPLSTGEQNFISLTFELLKAKNCTAHIILIDDPISSSDSIYKNKIAYCLLKILENKQVLIFTHNLDLVRLLDVQKTHCFNAYFLQNNPSNSGFIPIVSEEREIVLYFDKLLELLRTNIIDDYITDKKLFMISLIPFMRALVKIMNLDPAEPPENYVPIKEQLTSLMHGKETIKVNLTNIYNLVFSKKIEEACIISARDIIALNLSNIEFFTGSQFPLLEKTLKQSLTFLYLRLHVEKTLHDKFPERTKKCELLGDYIYKALIGVQNQKFRVQLTSKKTLLNEFNHFEGNFNLFQPALDISENNLNKETIKILSILQEIIHS